MGRSSQLVRVLSQAVMVMALCVGIGGMVSNGEDNDLMKQCTTAIQDLGNCLMFVTAKEAEPTKACCSAVSAMKDKQPVCLCLFIGQAHNGTNPALKGLGIQEAKLLQLPNACHLTNASVTNCPSKLIYFSFISPY
uniref:Bifunctional inhibitor/plant lipid transfer protein/seed storage helical domain-containing protein n=1 Tax=Opuntia streptacantha TaxID=393608 RepID=A0A7C9CYX9_OPUST